MVAHEGFPQLAQFWALEDWRKSPKTYNDDQCQGQMNDCPTAMKNNIWKLDRKEFFQIHTGYVSKSGIPKSTKLMIVAGGQDPTHP